MGGEGSSQAAVLVHGWGADKSSRHVLETAAVYEGGRLRRAHSRPASPRRVGGREDHRRLPRGARRGRRALVAWEAGLRTGSVVLHGWSMGGAAVIQAAPGTGVAAVVEESAYADLPRCCGRGSPRSAVCRPSSPPASSSLGSISLGIDPWAVRPVEEAGDSPAKAYRS